MKSSTGDYIPDGLPEAYHYTAGVMDYATITDGTHTWKQTYTYNADGTVATKSAWVLQ